MLTGGPVVAPVTDGKPRGTTQVVTCGYLMINCKDDRSVRGSGSEGSVRGSGSEGSTRQSSRCLLLEPSIGDNQTLGRSLSRHSTLEVDQISHQFLVVDNGSSPLVCLVPIIYATSVTILLSFLTNRTGATHVTKLGAVLQVLRPGTRSDMKFHLSVLLDGNMCQKDVYILVAHTSGHLE
ncbi:hypothetical protein Tco_0212288 [Tanacetum coccineum]